MSAPILRLIGKQAFTGIVQDGFSCPDRFAGTDVIAVSVEVVKRLAEHRLADHNILAGNFIDTVAYWRWGILTMRKPGMVLNVALHRFYLY